jgi:flagellar biosynthesis protein FlhF
MHTREARRVHRIHVAPGRPVRERIQEGAVGHRIGRSDRDRQTTTIAKLAANYRLRDSLNVGIITLDAHRPGAAEQLKTYADIIDAPFRSARTCDELRNALASMNACAIILIDTNGVSPNDEERLAELRRLLHTASADEVHLVLAGTSHAAALRHVMDRFATLGVDRVIFTKLDEAVGFGTILTCLQNARAKLSYVTNGQRVPSDIREGRDARLADLLMPQANGESTIEIGAT